MNEVVIRGTPDRVLDKIVELRETIGLDYLMCAPLSHQSFTLFTEKVLPKLIFRLARLLLSDIRHGPGPTGRTNVQYSSNRTGAIRLPSTSWPDSSSGEIEHARRDATVPKSSSLLQAPRLALISVDRTATPSRGPRTIGATPSCSRTRCARIAARFDDCTPKIPG